MVIMSKGSLQNLCVFFLHLLIHMKPAAFELNLVGVKNGTGPTGTVVCKERERQALLKIKHDFIDKYGYLSSWKAEEGKRDCCKWGGITCSNRTGHVIELDLQAKLFKPLRGKVSQSLLELRHLTYLDLSNNDFGGTQFPADNNGSHTKLRHLYLSYSNFTGTISKVLWNLSGLHSVDLSGNYFSDIGNSQWVSGLSSLTYLDLSLIPLINPNNWLQLAGKLPLLETLLLPSCFSGKKYSILIPSAINSSSSLATLDLSANNLAIPLMFPWLSNITQNIIELDLSSNILYGPTELFFENMISLESLGLSNTTLVGCIPKSFGNMSRLSSLDLSSNNLNTQLTDVIQNLSGCKEKSLMYLALRGNQLTGSLPPDIARFSSLMFLYLGNNHLNGTIDKSIGRLSNLFLLELSWNSLHGVISEEHFSNMSNLKLLLLSGNSFIWNVSHDWVPPFRLKAIYLQSCNIGRHFPKWFRTQKNYSMLDISDAGISDSIPKWFWDLSFQIYHLNLSNNNLSGTVPNFSFEFSLFPVIDISSNRFHGPLPMPLFPFKLPSSTLSEIRLFASSMSSKGETISLPLIYLDLSNNLFSGVLPDNFMHLQDLVFLNLASNNLSGKIPTSIASLWKLETLNLANNALSGELPLSLNNCTRLRFVDISGNKLFGNVPAWIGESLPSLQYLSLQSNQFHGNIPLQLCQLTNVQILDLSVNNINGTIPHCLENLRAMANGNLTKSIVHDYGLVQYGSLFPPDRYYIDKALVLWKRRKYMFDKNLGLLRIIDLSSNKLQGEIPKELSSLSGLIQLNLSSNKLSGVIPEEFGRLKQLESLDLSINQLSGNIPATMADLNFLTVVDLSYNNLSGRIPPSTQLQSFSASSFTGNLALCGLPLPQKCPGDETPQLPPTFNVENKEDDGDDEFKRSLYVGMAFGFIVGFWGVSSTLLLKRSYRHAFFQFLDKLRDWLYVRTIVCIRRLLRKFHG